MHEREKTEVNSGAGAEFSLQGSPTVLKGYNGVAVFIDILISNLNFLSVVNPYERIPSSASCFHISH